MGQPAAKKGDQVKGICAHKVKVPAPALTAILTPLPFAGIIGGGLSANVRIQCQQAATKDSTADNTPVHVFSTLPAATDWVAAPSNKATIKQGSATVKINGKPAARSGDSADTCDENKLPGAVVATGTVNIGG